MQRPRRTKFIKYVFFRALPFPRNVVSMKLFIVLAIQVDEIRVNLFPNPEILVSHGNGISDCYRGSLEVSLTEQRLRRFGRVGGFLT